MSGDNISNDKDCGSVRELLVWLPTGSLGPSEIERVEGHVMACEGCAALLDFASDFKAILVEEFPAHPSAGELVEFAENSGAMDSNVRTRIQNHIEACRDCRDEVEMLETVERTASAEDVAASRSREISHQPVGDEGDGRRWWDVFLGAALKPAAAAVYLVIAIAAVSLFVSRPDRLTLQTDTESILGGVMILSDESMSVRGVEPAFDPATLDPDEAQFLLLELIGLDEPPMPDDTYTVRITEPGAHFVWERSVFGRTFIENYTLCLYLKSGLFDTGEYDVDVVDDSGERVFHSTLFVK